jgi:hypothetical protein
MLPAKVDVRFAPGRWRELGSRGGKIFRTVVKTDEAVVLLERGGLSKARALVKCGNSTETRGVVGLVG